MNDQDKILSGSISEPKNLYGSISPPVSLTGSLSSPHSLGGFLTNATLRGTPVELRVDGSMLQWKYEDQEEWNDLINLQGADYNQLANKPTINGVFMMGEINPYVMIPQDELSNSDIAQILNK